jgi:hypothetical protein
MLGYADSLQSDGNYVAPETVREARIRRGGFRTFATVDISTSGHQPD